MPHAISTRSSAVPDALSRREPFTTYGSLRAAAGGDSSVGRLPEPYRTAYRDAWWSGALTYTVYSYHTPIAWQHSDGTVVIPPVTYSPTTSRHQGLLSALGQPLDGPRQRAAHPERQHRPDRFRTAASSGADVWEPAA